MNNKLIVFLRKASIGQVKTRLAVSIGDEMALQIYKWLVSQTINTAIEVNAEVSLYFDQMDKELNVPSSFSKKVQEGNDLGEKMYNSFGDHVMKDASKNLVVIGSDCPEISSIIIEEAFANLAKYDLVIGPALDGGFYLLGLKKQYLELFNGISWGGPEVYRKLVSNAAVLNLSICVLESKRDIDDIADFRLFKKDFDKYALNQFYYATEG